MSKDATQRALQVAAVTAGIGALAGTVAAISRRIEAPAAADEIQRTITIGRKPDELFDAWLSLLPQTMASFADVTLLDGERVRWQLRGPLSRTFDTAVDRAPSCDRISWWTAGEHAARFAGSVAFRPAPGDWGTETVLRLDVALPRQLAGPAMRLALRRFKSLIETGEAPTLERNPSARDAGGPV